MQTTQRRVRVRRQQGNRLETAGRLGPAPRDLYARAAVEAGQLRAIVRAGRAERVERFERVDRRACGRQSAARDAVSIASGEAQTS